MSQHNISVDRFSNSTQCQLDTNSVLHKALMQTCVCTSLRLHRIVYHRNAKYYNSKCNWINRLVTSMFTDQTIIVIHNTRTFLDLLYLILTTEALLTTQNNVFQT